MTHEIFVFLSLLNPLLLIQVIYNYDKNFTKLLDLLIVVLTISMHIIISLIKNIQLCKCEKIYCQEASGSVQFVESCPTSKAEWDNAARRKDCSRIAAQQNCRTVEYHCVINEYRNDTLEVCAPSKFIFCKDF